MKNYNFSEDLLTAVIAGILILIIIISFKISNIKDTANRTEKVVATACSTYGEKDPQLALICARNGF